MMPLTDDAADLLGSVLARHEVEVTSRPSSTEPTVLDGMSLTTTDAKSSREAAAAGDFLDVYDSYVRFSLETILTVSSLIVNTYVLVAIHNFKKNRQLAPLRRQSLYTLLFVNLTIVNLVSAPVTLMSHNLFFAGQRWSWFPISLSRLDFCEFFGALVIISAASMLVNLAATFMMLGFSIVQCIAINCPLKQLLLLHKRNIYSYVGACWLAVLIGWLTMISIVLATLKSNPEQASSNVRIISTTSEAYSHFNISAAEQLLTLPASSASTSRLSTSTLAASDEATCHMRQFRKVVQISTNFSYLSTFLITFAYITSFFLCMMTYFKIKRVSKEMAEHRVAQSSSTTNQSQTVHKHSLFTSTTHKSSRSSTNSEIRVKNSDASGGIIEPACFSCYKPSCSNCSRLSPKMSSEINDCHGSMNISNKRNHSQPDTLATSGELKITSAPVGQIAQFEICQASPESAICLRTPCRSRDVGKTTKNGTTKADKRAFVTIAALGVTLTFYLVPSLIVQFLTNGPGDGAEYMGNPFLIYFMSLQPYTKYLVDPLIYGLRMPEMKTIMCGSMWANCFKVFNRHFSR